MPTFVRVRDTTTGHEFDVSEESLAGLPSEVVILDEPKVEGRNATARPPTYAVDRDVPKPVRDPNLPPKSALKSEWVDYAVSRGMDPSTAESLTRDGLAAHFTEES